MATHLRPGFVAADPQWVKRRGASREVYGLSPSLLVWRDKAAEGACRMCRRAREVRPLTRHHLVPESWFRTHRRLHLVRNVAANVVPLCRPCHDLVETAEGARRELRRLLAPDEITFALQTAGRAWLERRYPTVHPSELGDRPTVRHAPGVRHRRDCHPVFGCVWNCPLISP